MEGGKRFLSEFHASTNNFNDRRMLALRTYIIRIEYNVRYNVTYWLYGSRETWTPCCGNGGQRGLLGASAHNIAVVRRVLGIWLRPVTKNLYTLLITRYCTIRLSNHTNTAMNPAYAQKHIVTRCKLYLRRIRWTRGFRQVSAAHPVCSNIHDVFCCETHLRYDFQRLCVSGLFGVRVRQLSLSLRQEPISKGFFWIVIHFPRAVFKPKIYNIYYVY